jgi:hypothetical protein
VAADARGRRVLASRRSADEMCIVGAVREGTSDSRSRRMACRDGLIAGRFVIPIALQLTRESILSWGGGGGRVLCCGTVTCLILSSRQGFPLDQSLFWAGAISSPQTQSVRADRRYGDGEDRGRSKRT